MNTKHIFSILAAAAMLCIPSQATAKRNTTDLSGKETIGFNALDHVLQKPLGNPEFPADNRGLWNHLFFEGGAGISAIESDGEGLSRVGYRANGAVGGWFTPVHGMRLSLAGGTHGVHEGVSRAYFMQVRAEYLLNFSSLLRGYDSSRWFELIGSAGPELQRVRQDGVWSKMAGITASLRAQFNVAPWLYLYAEPRIDVMAAHRRIDEPHDWRRIRTDLSFNVGMGYRIITGAERSALSMPFYNIKDDNIFVGFGGGIFDLTRRDFPGHFFREHMPVGQAFIGKGISSTSALRVNMLFGLYTGPQYVATGALDYVLDLNSACGGYRPNDVFRLSAIAGVGAAYSRNNGTLAPGVEVGLEGLFRLSDNWGIYITPQVGLYGRKFAHSLGKKQSPMTSVMLGLRYTTGSFYHLNEGDYEAYQGSRKYFLTFSGAPSWRLRHGHQAAINGNVGFGKRFTPISTWRITADGTAYPTRPRQLELVLSADYLSSITTAMCGYDPDRVFDLSGVLGVQIGFAANSYTHHAVYGLKTGLHGSFRLTDGLNLFVEPQFVAQRGIYRASKHSWIPEGRVMLGLEYKLGTAPGVLRSFADMAYGAADSRNFVSVAGGPNAFSAALHKRPFPMRGALDVSVGRWFTSVSALRLTYGIEWLAVHKRDGSTIHTHSGRLDYMLNVTSLLDGSSDRHFHIIGVAGAGLGYTPGKGESRNVGVLADAGVQFRWNLSNGFDLHVEPQTLFRSNRLMPREGRGPARFNLSGRLMLGASYRF